jgi:hypothetical protein
MIESSTILRIFTIANNTLKNRLGLGLVIKTATPSEEGVFVEEITERITLLLPRSEPWQIRRGFRFALRYSPSHRLLRSTHSIEGQSQSD